MVHPTQQQEAFHNGRLYLIPMIFQHLIHVMGKPDTGYCSQSNWIFLYANVCFCVRRDKFGSGGTYLLLCPTNTFKKSNSVSKIAESLDIKNYKHQITNNKWFDKLTTLSPVEGQYPNSKFQWSKQVLTCREPWIRALRLWAQGRTAQAEGEFSSVWAYT